jgi:cell division septation protein DedD
VDGAAATGGTTEPDGKQATNSQVHPALGATAGSQVKGWMVQIAAVSHSEDAQVLVDALRKRGYEVTARREVSDNLIHVQTGPFVNRNDANAMRQKLLNDGYNAVVE